MVPPSREKAEDDRAYDSADWMAAGKSPLWRKEIPIGKFFERTDVPSSARRGAGAERAPLAHADTRIPVAVTRAFVEELM